MALFRSDRFTDRRPPGNAAGQQEWQREQQRHKASAHGGDYTRRPARQRRDPIAAVGGLFEKAFRYFQFKADEYMEHYHKRSNLESTFSTIASIGSTSAGRSSVASSFQKTGSVLGSR
jgi:hypothetical protein